MESNKLNRRRFLQLSATLAAAGVVTACGGGAATATTGTASSSSSSSSSSSTSSAAAATTKASSSASTSSGPPPTIAVNQTNATPASGGTPAAKPAQYKEAPALADMVKAGKLPPVEKRLPDNPRVLKPLQEVGQYGGTWHRAYTGLSDRVGPTKLGEEMLIEWDAPDPNTINIIANVVEKWEQNSDASEYTFHLRKGMKWSDGQDVTTDDAKFWFEDVQLNKDITPAPNFAASQNISGQIKLATLTVVDAQTFKMKYAAPYPLLPITIAKLNGDFILPMHYLKNYHPKYTSMDQLNKVVADKKVTTWTELWGKAGDGQGPIYFWFVNPDLPMIRNWTMTVVPPADPIVAVRNPYYWQVDTDGNQLPYIDKVEHVIYQSNDVLNLKIASGQIDMQMRHLDAGSYTFYKENEQKGGYKTFKWRAASTNAYFPNINCPDPVLAKLFDTPEFRQALNIAIDRKKINDLVWNGLGSPRQTAPVKGSPEYDPDLEKAWTEYNPDQANSLLDKIGLTKNPDGSRKRSDGKPLEITVEHTTIAGSPEDDQHQRVKAYWEAIGVKTNMKYVERSLYEEHVHNAEVQLGYWGFDRCSVVKADPGRFLGTIDDGPWAPAFGHWYAQSPYKKTEPPQDHPIRDIWKNWEATAAEPDEAKRKADFQKILDIWKQHPYAVGVVGEMVVPMVVRNNFRNILDGYIDDDTLRDSGLLNPQQFYLKQS